MPVLIGEDISERQAEILDVVRNSDTGRNLIEYLRIVSEDEDIRSGRDGKIQRKKGSVGEPT